MDEAAIKAIIESKDEIQDFQEELPMRTITTGSIIALIVAFFEGIINYAVFMDQISVGFFIMAHFVISIILGLWVFVEYKNKKDLKHPMFLLIFTFFMGVVGPFLFLIMELFLLIYKPYAESFSNWFAWLFPEDKFNEADALYQRLVAGWDDLGDKRDVTPFIDVMNLGTENQKRTALAHLARHFSPEFGPILLKAVKDPSNAIRVQAATTIARIEDHYYKAAMILEKRHRRNPENLQHLLQLAFVYDSYAQAGFLDQDHASEIRKKAIACFEQYLEKHDSNVAKFHLARLYQLDGAMDKSYNLFEDALATAEHVTPKMILWFMECLFAHKHFDQLNHVAVTYFPQFQSQGFSGIVELEMIEFWSKG